MRSRILLWMIGIFEAHIFNAKRLDLEKGSAFFFGQYAPLKLIKK
jgi:hypothetical protein